MLNKDGMETPVRDASILAHPERASDPDSPEYDYIGGYNTEPFPEPLTLIAQYQPEAIALFEKSLTIEERRLRMQFAREAAVQKNADMGTLERVWGKITQALGFNHS